MGSLGGGAGEDNPHESSFSSMGSLGGGASEDDPHDSSSSSLGSLGGGAGKDDPHESSFSSLGLSGGGADENMLNFSFSSIGSLADIIGMEDLFCNLYLHSVGMEATLNPLKMVE